VSVGQPVLPLPILAALLTQKLQAGHHEHGLGVGPTRQRPRLVRVVAVGRALLAAQVAAQLQELPVAAEQAGERLARVQGLVRRHTQRRVALFQSWQSFVSTFFKFSQTYGMFFKLPDHPEMVCFCFFY